MNTILLKALLSVKIVLKYYDKMLHLFKPPEKKLNSVSSLKNKNQPLVTSERNK